MHAAITIDDIDREIASGTRFLQFAPPVEAMFEAEAAVPRLRLLVVSGLFALVLYDLYLVGDYALMRDVFGPLVVLRLGVYTPMVLIALCLVWWFPSNRSRESVAVFVSVLAVVLPSSTLFYSMSPHKLQFQLGTLVIMTYFTVIQRMRFRYAVVAILATAGTQLAMTQLSGAFDADILAGNAVLFSTTGMLLLFAAYVLEHGERRGFLMGLRSRLLQADLERLTYTDPLTGLSNRRHMDDVTRALWARNVAIAVSAILVDVDRFKLFNDSYGHLAGDDCLRQVSDVVQRVEKTCDCADALAVRFGGEEFLVLLPGLGFEEARTVAERLHQGIRDLRIPHPALKADASVTGSVGVATILLQETSFVDLIAAADAALYVAKRSGRDRVCPARAKEVERLGLILAIA